MPANYQVATPKFLEVARQYQEDLNTAYTYMNETKMQERVNQNGNHVDTRDFLPMLLLVGIEGETKEERTKDIQQKLEKMADAFSDPDREKRNDYLDLIYYMVDDFANNFDPVTMNMNDPAAVAQLLQSMLLTQTVGTKEEENPEYYQKRYPTPEERNLADACQRYALAIGSTVSTNLDKNHISIYVDLSLPRPLPDQLMDLQYLREQYERGLLDKAIATGGKLEETKTVDFPILDSLVPYCAKTVAGTNKYSETAQEQVGAYFSYMVENTLLQNGSKNTMGMKMAGISKMQEGLYVDGKPFLEFMNERYPKGTTNGLINVVGATCVLSGKHKVDVVNAYPDKDGVMRYEVKTIKPVITQAQEELYMQQFSKFRRKWFNWGPFRIKSLKEQMERIANDPKADARRSRVLADHRAKIEAGIEREKELQRQEQMKAKANPRAIYNAAREKLEASVTQWDKESVLGVLGEQITATYEIRGEKMNGACAAISKWSRSVQEPERYERVAPLFVKVLLYSQLCSERNANGGEPGEREKMLGTGDIRKNIEETAEQLAKTPSFKAFFMEKLGAEEGRNIGTSRSRFEQLIASGGCPRFWMEYQQRVNNVDGPKEQKTAVNQEEPVNRKQAEGPVANM